MHHAAKGEDLIVASDAHLENRKRHIKCDETNPYCRRYGPNRS